MRSADAAHAGEMLRRGSRLPSLGTFRAHQTPASWGEKMRSKTRSDHFIETVAGNGLLGRGAALAGAVGVGAGGASTGAAAEPLAVDPWSLVPGITIPPYGVPSRF